MLPTDRHLLILETHFPTAGARTPRCAPSLRGLALYQALAVLAPMAGRPERAVEGPTPPASIAHVASP